MSRLTPNQPARNSLLKGTGSLIEEIHLQSVHPKPDISVTHENLVTLTSYNLLEKRKQTIIIPGSPAVWIPRTPPVNLKPDAGRCISDPASYVFPGRSLEPLFRALFTTRPEFNLNGTDIVGDRRNMRLLLDFASGCTAQFRIDVEVVGDTVLLSRWERRPVRYLTTFGGYGHAFEDGFTQHQRATRGSISHNRVISYTLGGVNVLMRFEVDGYIEGALPTTTLPMLGTYTGPSHTLMKSYNTPKTPTGVTIIIRGQFVAPSRVIEIKTCTMGSSLHSKALAQMWFSQTPILCGGKYAEPGVFSSLTTIDIAERLVTWEKDNEEKIKKLVRVIEMICEVVKKVPGGKCSIVHTRGSGTLGVYSAANGDYRGLPPDILARLGSSSPSGVI